MTATTEYAGAPRPMFFPIHGCPEKSLGRKYVPSSNFLCTEGGSSKNAVEILIDIETGGRIVYEETT